MLNIKKNQVNSISHIEVNQVSSENLRDLKMLSRFISCNQDKKRLLINQ